MTQTLILFGASAPHAPLEAIRLDAAGAVLGRDIAPASRTILILSAAEARLRALDIAARTDAQARAAAPYFFEGALGAEETMHFALAAPAPGSRLVACMSAARLTAWLEACRAAGAAPDAIYLDATLWASPPGEAHVFERAGLAVLAAGAQGGVAIEPALAPAILPRWLAEVGLGEARRADPALDVETILARAALSPPPHAPNLLQGAFAPAAAGPAPWRLWRFAAALAILAFGLQLGAMVIDGVRDRQAAERIMALAEEDFRAARPDVRRIVNLRAQVAAIANAEKQAARHPVLQTSEPIIRMLSNTPLVRLDEVRHAGPERVVRVRLSAPQAAPLEAAAQTLRGESPQSEARALPPSEGRYAMEVSLESAP